MSASGLRKNLRKSPWGRVCLSAAALIYGAVIAARNALYRWGLLPSRKLPVRTVCVGNLTVGGTGKTSAVLLAAKTLHARQIKTAILSRGYKRTKGRREVQVLLNSTHVSWQETGDEPWMMHRALKGLEVPILVHPDRYRAGLEALDYYEPQVLLLDDGFQHRRLRRDLDIVLINAEDPFGGGSLLPTGNLREPAHELRRAGLAVITHADRVDEDRLKEIHGEIAALAPKIEILESAHKPDCLFDLKEDAKRRLAHIKGKRIACLSAIGHPEGFEDLLRKCGAHLTQVWRYPDHHPFTASELRSVEIVREGIPLVTTLKDFPRLPAGWQNILSGEVLALNVRMEITKGKTVWEETLCGPSAG